MSAVSAWAMKRATSGASTRRRTSNTSRASCSLGCATVAPRLGVSVTMLSLARRTSTGRMRVRDTPKASARRSSTSLVPGSRRWSSTAEIMRS